MFGLNAVGVQRLVQINLKGAVDKLVDDHQPTEDRQINDLGMVKVLSQLPIQFVRDLVGIGGKLTPERNHRLLTRIKHQVRRILAAINKLAPHECQAQRTGIFA